MNALIKAKRRSVSSSDMLDAVLRRDGIVIILLLVTIIAASWLYLLAGAGTGMYRHEMAVVAPAQMLMTPDSWTPGYAILMFSMWWLMMIAMMLPSAAPMVILHAAVSRTRLERAENGRSDTASRRPLSSTIAFIAGYLVMWGAFSLIATGAQWALERGELLSATINSTSEFLGSALLLAAGLWQLTPLKSVCLRHCRSPLSFLSTHWRPGVGGAFRMGTEHGVFCLGCCWFLMALLFYGGVMNLIWIIGLASFVLLEKMIPAGVAIGRVAGLLLIVWGFWLAFPGF